MGYTCGAGVFFRLEGISLAGCRGLQDVDDVLKDYRPLCRTNLALNQPLDYMKDCLKRWVEINSRLESDEVSGVRAHGERRGLARNCGPSSITEDDVNCLPVGPGFFL